MLLWNKGYQHHLSLDKIFLKKRLVFCHDFFLSLRWIIQMRQRWICRYFHMSIKITNVQRNIINQMMEPKSSPFTLLFSAIQPPCWYIFYFYFLSNLPEEFRMICQTEWVWGTKICQSVLTPTAQTHRKNPVIRWPAHKQKYPHKCKDIL